ncbi:unnamed protein product [Bursaphelenchus xylophilus]|nr:unnamed protein product [Bursaphelenchus xylophilus]CAG9088035.1 unnamed protein product [Bursaphelenchus xylophilus]
MMMDDENSTGEIYSALDQLSCTTCPDDFAEFVENLSMSNAALRTGMSDPEMNIVLENQDKLGEKVMAQVDEDQIEAQLAPELAIAVYCDGQKLFYDENSATENGFSFFFKDLYLKFKTDSTNVLEVRTDHPTPYMEWKVVAQVRISASDGTQKFNVVDGDVFGLGKYDPPIFLQLDHSKGDVKGLKVDMRLIEYSFEKVSPSYFKDTDVTITFNDGSDDFYTYGNLLQLHSHVLGRMIKRPQLLDVYGHPVIQLAPEDRGMVTELLVYLYPNSRPIYPRFRTLCRAAWKFQCPAVMFKIGEWFIKHISSHKPTLLEKIEEALMLGIGDVVIPRLVFDAVKNGEWAKLIGQVSEPNQLFPADVYDEIIAPACLYARKHKFFSWPKPSELIPRPKDDTDPSVVRLVYSGVTVFAHRGVLQAHNMSRFGVSASADRKEYYPIFTVETREYLNNLHIDLRHFLNEFVDFVYYNKPICEACIRPMLIFAHDNELVYLKGKMEAAIAMQPPISTNIMREHLTLASKYGLDNLLRTTLVRAEGHYITVAQALVGQSGIVNELTIPTMRKLADRLCTGWSLINWKMAERTPTTRNVRRIFLDEGGPVVPTANPTLESFYGLNSDDAYGDPI